MHPDIIGRPIDLGIGQQTLKERFAELLPEKIEQIKQLRKYGLPHLMSPAETVEQHC
jgi:hypothetical protein